MWRPLKVAEADQWLNRRGKYVVYAACLSLSLPSIIAIKAVTGSERRSHYLEPGPAMPLLCRRRSAKHQSGTWTLGRAHSSGIGITLHVQSDRIHAAIRSEERRVGKESVSKCRYRWSQDHKKKKK